MRTGVSRMGREPNFQKSSTARIPGIRSWFCVTTQVKKKKKRQPSSYVNDCNESYGGSHHPLGTVSAKTDPGTHKEPCYHLTLKD